MAEHDLSRRVVQYPDLMGILGPMKPPINTVGPEYLGVMHDLSPVLLARERAIAQGAELLLIRDDATAIEQLLRKKNLPPPIGYSVFTSGFRPPENSILLGKFGEPPFEGFPPPEAIGHEGGVYVVPVNDQGDILFVLTGRPHPTEWIGERFAPMIVAHPLRVIREMQRRQRADQGIDPPIILTYVTGVVEGHEMKPGDAGIIISDSEQTNVMHPGFGPVSLLDKYLGPHFEPKLGRSATVALSQNFAALARDQGIPLFPVSVCGTPGTPEFQNDEEVAMFMPAFEEARRRHSGQLAGLIFGLNGQDMLAPLFDMGITFEQAIFRQKHQGERDIRRMNLALATDEVGGEQSLNIDHAAVFAKALAEAPKYQRLMLEYAAQFRDDPNFKIEDRTDYSLRKLTVGQQ